MDHTVKYCSFQNNIPSIKIDWFINVADYQMTISSSQNQNAPLALVESFSCFKSPWASSLGHGDLLARSGRVQEFHLNFNGSQAGRYTGVVCFKEGFSQALL